MSSHADFQSALNEFDAAVQKMGGALRAEHSRFLAEETDDDKLLVELETTESKMSAHVEQAGLLFTTYERLARRARNSRLPINKLSSELLLLVFEFVVATATFGNHYQTTYTFASVCSPWKALVESCPTLWTRLSSTFTEHHIKNILRKSGSRLLIVEFQAQAKSRSHWGDNSAADTAEEQRRLQFAELVKPEIHRIRAIRLDPTWVEIAELSKRSADNLKYLWIHQGHEGSAPSEPIFNGTAPRLLGIHIESAPLTPYVSLLCNIHYLKINRCNDSCFATRTFLKALLECRNLVHLYVDQVYPSSWGWNEPEELKDAYIPSLETMRLTAVRPQLVLEVLACLRAPNLKQVHIDAERGQHESVSHAEAVEALGKMLTSDIVSQRPPSDVRLQLQPTADGLWLVRKVVVEAVDEVFGSHHSLAVAQWEKPLPLEETLAGLERAFNPDLVQSTAVHLEIWARLPLDAVMPQLYDELATRLPNVKSLKDYRKLRGTTGQLCHFLGQPFTLDSRWAFPNLEELELHVSGEEEGEGPLAMLRNRYTAVPNLAHLRRFNLSSWSKCENLIRSIEGIVGSGVATWNQTQVPVLPKCWGGAEDVGVWFNSTVGKRLGSPAEVEAGGAPED